jgi:hypothetical protein
MFQNQSSGKFRLSYTFLPFLAICVLLTAVACRCPRSQTNREASRATRLDHAGPGSVTTKLATFAPVGEMPIEPKKLLLELGPDRGRTSSSGHYPMRAGLDAKAGITQPYTCNIDCLECCVPGCDGLTPRERIACLKGCRQLCCK